MTAHHIQQMWDRSGLVRKQRPGAAFMGSTLSASPCLLPLSLEALVKLILPARTVTFATADYAEGPCCTGQCHGCHSMTAGWLCWAVRQLWHCLQHGAVQALVPDSETCLLPCPAPRTDAYDPAGSSAQLKGKSKSEKVQVLPFVVAGHPCLVLT